MSVLDKKKYTLILNQNYYPLSVEGVKRTIKHFIDGAEALDPVTYQRFTFDEWIELYTIRDPLKTIRSQKLWFLIPEILILGSDFMPTAKRRFSKRKVFTRDSLKCGYCLCKLTSENKTIDHVIPFSKGGKTTYKNIVSCCLDCNGKKADRTYEEMRTAHGWKLHHKLIDPDKNILYHVPTSKVMDSWGSFLERMPVSQEGQK